MATLSTPSPGMSMRERGSVKQIKAGPYAGRWRATLRMVIAGRELRQEAIRDTKWEAERVRAEWVEKGEARKVLDAYGLPPPPDPDAVAARSTPFSTICREWLLGCAVRPSTRAGYERHLDLHIDPVLGRIGVAALDLRDVRRFRTLLLRGHSAAGVQRIEATLRAALRYAVRAGLLDRNPLDDMERLRPPQHLDFRIFTFDEIDGILAACEPEWAAWFRVAFDTGLRSGELRALARDDLDLPRDPGRPAWLTVSRSVARVSGQRTADRPKGRRPSWQEDSPKSGKRRRVPLTPAAREVLRAWPRRTDSPLVFPATRGAGFRTDTAIKGAFLRAQRAAGIMDPGHPHDTRHTWATLLLRAGVDARTVQKLGGWSSLALVERYTHADDSTMADAATLLDRAARNRPDAQPDLSRASKSGATDSQ